MRTNKFSRRENFNHSNQTPYVCIDELIGMARDTSRTRSALTCSGFGIFLTMITVVHCVPIEIVYTGDSCDCPTKLDYAINIPKVPQQRKYARNDYGYKIDTPVPAKAKVSYSFDFFVEEPKTPRPSPNTKWNLYAKVDRIAVNKPDCRGNRPPPPPPPAPACKCGGRPNPGYRYVSNSRMPPCFYQFLKYKWRNNERTPNPSPNSIDNAKLMYATVDTNGQIVTGRRLKRDLYRNFFRSRKAANERTGRFVKLYSKNIPSKSMNKMFGFDTLMEPIDKSANNNLKRKFKKAYFPRLVKRDIKGEYDQLEKDREQIDLTLPEIIQFMPEALQPSFKRGQCIFGNDCIKAVILKQTAKTGFNKKNHVTNENATDETDDIKSDVAYAKNTVQKKTSAKQKPSTTFKKRNAATYEYDSGIPLLNAPVTARVAIEAKSPLVDMPAPTFANAANDCVAKQSPQIDSETLADKPTLLPQTLQPSPYELDRVADTDKINMPTEQFKLSSDQPYDSAGSPLQYAGASNEYYDTSDRMKVLMATERQMLNTPYVHPVHHVSNEELDRMVSDIVYKHPDFIDATYHFGGTLVDPEPLQEQQVRDFLKKLIDGRLNLWFKEEESHTPLYYISSYDTPPSPYVAKT